MPYISNDQLVQKPQNVDTLFREYFETYDKTNVWSESKDSTDLIYLDGNSIGLSYLVISKDPLTANTESSVTTVATFDEPIEIMVGASRSQAVLGQECSIEYVSTDTPLALPADKTIASIQRTTTTTTVTTSTAHGLTAGMRIGITGVSDSRLNDPSLVVATVSNTTTFTTTAGPGGTIASASIGPLTNQGYVYARSAMGGAPDGFVQVFENATATNASFYTRSDSGDYYPSGTFNGNHCTATVGSTTANQPFVSPYTYNFINSTEYRYRLQNDRLDVYDLGFDSGSQATSRLSRTVIVPNIDKTFKLRFRCTNVKGLPVPTAKIVSAVKSASTTATITTDVAHGLTTSDFIVIYGIRDQTNFANQTTQVAVASVINSTQFTVVFGVSATATSYGGMVLRAQGGQVAGGLSTNHVIQTATVASGELTLTSSANWVPLIGDTVNVYGCRNATNGGDMGVDGVYKVVNVATTTLTLIPLGSTVLPAPFGSTNCGGTVIKRTDFRINYVKIFKYLRQRIEVLNNSIQYGSLPVVVNGINSGTVSTVSTVSTASLAINTLVNDLASTTALTTTTTSSAVTPASGSLSHEFNIIVTAITGTNPTLDLVVQESDDTGTNWYDVYHFQRITATGQYRSPLIPLTGNRIRYVQTVGGSGVSITRAVNRHGSQTSAPIIRQFYSRALVGDTLNSATATFYVDGCANYTAFISTGAVTTTAPTIAVDVSPDGTEWVQVGADIVTVANTNNVLSLSNIVTNFMRIRVKVAGSGSTIKFVQLKGTGY